MPPLTRSLLLPPVALLLAASTALSSEPPPLVPPRLLEGTPLEIDPILEAAAREVEGSPLGLGEAIATALSQSPDLAERALLPAISQAQLRAREGVYALRGFASGVAAREVTPAASALAGADEIELRDYAFGAGLVQPVKPGGGEVRLRLDNTVSETNSSFASLSPEYVPRLALELSQPLLKDLLVDARRTDVRLAELSRDVATLDLSADVRATVERVEARYWDLHFAMRDTQIARIALELGRRLLENSQRRLELGAVPWPDVLDVEASVSEAEDGLVAARARFREASDALKRSLGLALSGPPLLTAELPSTDRPVPDEAALWVHTRERREDLRGGRVGGGARAGAPRRGPEPAPAGPRPDGQRRVERAGRNQPRRRVR